MRLLGGEDPGSDNWPGPPIPGEEHFKVMKNKILFWYYDLMVKKYGKKARKAKDPVARTYYSRMYWHYFNKGVGHL